MAAAIVRSLRTACNAGCGTTAAAVAASCFFASPRGGAKGLFDEVEEGLMESILDAEAHGP